MADIVHGNYFPFPSLFRSFWDDENEFSAMAQTQSNLAISEDEKHVYIEAALPGIDPKNVEVTYDKGLLYIRGNSQETEDDKKKNFYRKATSSFSYRIAVPGEIDQNSEPQAESKNGVMKVTFAKVPQAQPKKITIKTA